MRLELWADRFFYRSFPQPIVSRSASECCSNGLLSPTSELPAGEAGSIPHGDVQVGQKGVALYAP